MFVCDRRVCEMIVWVSSSSPVLDYDAALCLLVMSELNCACV